MRNLTRPFQTLQLFCSPATANSPSTLSALRVEVCSDTAAELLWGRVTDTVLS